jgi:AraC-like DNA-binding protein
MPTENFPASADATDRLLQKREEPCPRAIRGEHPHGFARSFKTSFGISTHQWLLQHRIEHAKELMSHTTMSLIEIAIQSGFNDQAAFTRTFHRLVGVSPGRWRRHYPTINFRE